MAGPVADRMDCPSRLSKMRSTSYRPDRRGPRAGSGRADRSFRNVYDGELADPFGTQPVHGRKHVDTSLESAIVQCGQGAQGCGERTLGIPGQPIAC